MYWYQAKAAVNLRPAKPDPPLKLNMSKPTFVNAKQNSAFGFKSTAPSDIVPDSDDDMEQDSEGVKNAEECLAQQIFNHNNNGESHSLL